VDRRIQRMLRQGLKPTSYFVQLAARLKPCPCYRALLLKPTSYFVRLMACDPPCGRVPRPCPFTGLFHSELLNRFFEQFQDGCTPCPWNEALTGGSRPSSWPEMRPCVCIFHLPTPLPPTSYPPPLHQVSRSIVFSDLREASAVKFFFFRTLGSDGLENKRVKRRRNGSGPQG